MSISFYFRLRFAALSLQLLQFAARVTLLMDMVALINIGNIGTITVRQHVSPPCALVGSCTLSPDSQRGLLQRTDIISVFNNKQFLTHQETSLQTRLLRLA